VDSHLNDARCSLKLDSQSNNTTVSLRTHSTEIPDIRGIADFVIAQQLQVEAFIGLSNVNLSWRVRLSGGSTPMVLSLGPKLSLFDSLCLANPTEMSYLDPDKFLKAQAVCQAAHSVGVPCPKVIRAGFDMNLKRAWMIQEHAKGINLANIWNTLSLQRRWELAHQIGELLASLHTSDAVEGLVEELGLDLPSNSQEWYKRRISKALQTLKEMVAYSTKEVERISSVADVLLERVTLSPPSLLHGDILHHNIFVEQEGSKHQRWYISSIIDWETAVVGGDPCYDTILGAWWMSSKLGTWNVMKGGPEIFSAVVEGYKASMTDESRMLEAEQLNEILALAELTYYVNILPFTICQSGAKIAAQRKQRIERIIRACAQGIPYYDAWPSIRAWQL
jgi:aminoglycoside phosphotransferase (APT) family kinase protein